MQTEAPVCLRCCFCFPLRYGLIALGYFKLIIATIMLVCLITMLYNLISWLKMARNPIYSSEIVIISIIMLIVLVDILLHAIFIAGAHMKEVRLLKVYYYYSLTSSILTAILSSFSVLALITTLVNHFHRYMVFISLSNLSALFVYFVIQIYVLLLVRSEIIKLSKNGQFRFVNNAADAECTVNIEVYENSGEKEMDNDNVEPENKREDNERTCEKANGNCRSSKFCKVVIE